MTLHTETHIIIGSSAYACVKYSGTFGDVFHCGTIDFKLPGGRGAPADLRRIANDHRERAIREMRYACIADAAADELARDKPAASFPNVVPCDSF